MAEMSHKFPPHKIDFLHCPIRDYGILPDKQLWGLISELQKLLEVDNRNIYIHCFGGHGSTGSVVVNLLEALFGVGKNSAMGALKRSHQIRGCHSCSLNLRRLESKSQEQQVERLEPITHVRQKFIKGLQKKIIE